MTPALHICLGTPAYHMDALVEDSQLGVTIWTINSKAKKGDGALFYMTSPKSAIVGRGALLKDAWKEADETADWHGYHMGEIGELEIFPAPISIKTLKSEIPSWRYWLSPVRSQRVPDEHRELLNRLLRRARGA